MKNQKNRIFLFSLLLTAMMVQACIATQKAAVEPTVSYQTDLLPIMQASCTPCHFPENGRKKMLDTYEATKENIDDIISRIELPVDNEKFMPFKSKRAPLTVAEINLFKTWVAQGMAE